MSNCRPKIVASGLLCRYVAHRQSEKFITSTGSDCDRTTETADNKGTATVRPLDCDLRSAMTRRL